MYLLNKIIIKFKNLISNAASNNNKKLPVNKLKYEQ